ncbi:hypothetical protein [Pseudonocardia endophytica]|uniref:Uncharacterized protein n=1 Tax=Pseudonocardia endophytica TaxID=401976 RepID=A0A4V2PHQ5_PSEEN|nr:hypothetical protein [Pseudonocardia endophytica]TCK21616.1 hypothetical protein EV378_5605 [Pseudonocardia endophytica]
MAIQFEDDRETVTQGPSWTDVLIASEICDGVFDVRWDVRPRLRRWLAAHDLPTACLREAHLPSVDAWALLDGGVISVSSVTVAGATPEPAWSPPLSAGMRVIGFRAFRLLVAELALAGPSSTLPGEPSTDPDALRAAFEGRVPDGATTEQAELLATCTDRSSLRWVAAALASPG